MVFLGPPAVGKMSVGRAVCAKSDFRLFHNHHMIEPLRDVLGGAVQLGRPAGVVRAAVRGSRRQTLRNRTEARLDAKPSKRDLAWSDANVREWEQYRTTTDPELPSAADDLLSAHPCLTLDNSGITAEDAAARILAWRADN